MSFGRHGGWLAASLIACVPAFAQPTDTAALAAHLKAARGVDSTRDDRFVLLRREMMRWVDTRILRGDSVSSINQELNANRLLIKLPVFKAGGDPAVTGYVDQVRLEQPPAANDVSLVHFGVGMDCGFDQSVIVYRREPLTRIGWIESPSSGGPMGFASISIGPSEVGRRILAAESYGIWCSSSFTPIHMEIWSVSPDSMRVLLTREANGRRR